MIKIWIGSFFRWRSRIPESVFVHQMLDIVADEEKIATIFLTI